MSGAPEASGSEAGTPASVSMRSTEEMEGSAGAGAAAASVEAGGAEAAAEVEADVAAGVECSCSVASSRVGAFFLLARRTASRSWMITFSMRRKKAWLDVLDVRGAMLGNCRSMPPFSLVGAVTTTVSLVNLRQTDTLDHNVAFSKMLIN